MCSGIAIPAAEFSDVLLERYRLRSRITSRGGEPEVRFLARDEPRILPAWVSSQLLVLPWGDRNGHSRLPHTPCLPIENLESGQYRELLPERVVIPATAGIENGRWYHIQEGITGIVAGAKNGRRHVYILTEPATHYYRIMTGSPRMPVLVNQQL